MVGSMVVVGRRDRDRTCCLDSCLSSAKDVGCVEKSIAIDAQGYLKIKMRAGADGKRS